MSQSFTSLGVSAEVEQSLAARGIVEPFRIQTLVVPAALAGGDILGQAPTGSGKTLAFGLPIVETLSAREQAPAALVLVPTRELALQVTEELSLLGAPRGIRAAAAYGGAPVSAQAKRLHGAHAVVATPGRLNDLIERRLISLDAIRILVLDEADRMLDMGFLPQVEKIVRRLPQRRQTMLFSATLDGEVGELARAYTTNPSRFEAELPSRHSDGEVEHTFVAVTAADKVESLVSLLGAERGLALVFVRTKRGADRLAHKLRGHGVDAAAMHGDMTQGARERALERFRSGKVTTLVATDVAARGLDLEAISHVINYDPPEDMKGYVHRVGRTGRAGRTGQGITLVLPDQQADVSRVANMLGHKEQFESGGMTSARPRLVYTSRRGRRSRW
ncbi:MAG TPA: DEAD/DEAH box helicase [Gaiellaceae bacterium]|nr:DEAD/DEAH box helicase [Gaiellaceae bacterium]